MFVFMPLKMGECVLKFGNTISRPDSPEIEIIGEVAARRLAQPNNEPIWFLVVISNIYLSLHAMVFKCQEDSFLKEYTSKVISCEEAQFLPVNNADEPKIDGYEIILENSIIFPEGGGQPSDFGYLNDQEVINVYRRADQVVHFVRKPFEVGEDVKQVINWERRMDNMQQHSGQHLISAVLERELNFNTESWYMGVETSYIELDTPTLSQDQIIRIEQLCNEYIREGRKVSVQVFDGSVPAESLDNRVWTKGAAVFEEDYIRIGRLHSKNGLLCLRELQGRYIRLQFEVISYDDHDILTSISSRDSKNGLSQCKYGFRNKNGINLSLYRSNRDLPSDHKGDIRVITIDGIDSNMCCGTHVTNLSQLQAVKLLHTEKSKRKNKILLHFLVGNRVIERLARCINQEQELTVLLKSNPKQHAELVEKLIQNVKVLNKNLQSVLNDIAVFEANKLKQSPAKYFILHRKEATADFMNAFIRELGKTDTFLFLSVGDEKGSGNILLQGEENAVSDLGPKICDLLEGKGARKGNRFQAKVSNMSKRKEAEKIIQQYFA